MGVTNYRKYGNKVVPKLLEKVDITAIVDDVTTGGTNLPLSAEQGKFLNQKVDSESTTRVQQFVDIKDGVSSDFNTLKKIETKVKAEEQARISANNYEAEQRAINIKAADDRAKLAEEAINATIVNNKQLTDASISGLRTDMGNADNGIYTVIGQNDTRAINAENVLNTKVDTEIDTRSTQYASLSARISSETENRTNQDVAIGQRIGLLEMALANGTTWKQSFPTVDGINTLNENEILAGWAYYVSGDKDVYLVIDGVDGDYKPESWGTKSFMIFQGFHDISQLVQGEKIRAMAEAAEIRKNIETLATGVDEYIAQLNRAIEASIQRAIDAEKLIMETVAKNAEDATIALAAEAKTRNDNDAAIVEKITITSNELKGLIQVSDERATQSEAALSKKIDDTKIAVDLTTNDLDRRLDVIENDENTSGSVKNALMIAMKYVDDMTPRMCLQGDDSQSVVVSDTITLNYTPLNGKNAVIGGEVIVYMLNGDVVPVRVRNIVGSTLFLAVDNAGDYDGGAAVLSYLYRNADQVGAGNAPAGQGGAGA